MTWMIYTLKCPLDDAVRYVGWTVKTIEHRLRAHIAESKKSRRKTHKTRWIMTLLSKGLEPIITMVEQGSGDNWSDTERRWIQFFLFCGARLTNSTNGGEGMIGIERVSIIDLRGQRFGKLVVRSRVDARLRGSTVWLCECDCGRFKRIISNMLRTAHAKSCGCLNRESAVTAHTRHGLASSSTWAAWKDMKRKYRETICASWLESFDNFLADMGVKPDGLRLSKIDQNGLYAPGNCEWTTRFEHAGRTRRNRYVTVGGKTLTISGWAREMGVSRFLIRDRLNAGLCPSIAVLGVACA